MVPCGRDCSGICLSGRCLEAPAADPPGETTGPDHAPGVVRAEPLPLREVGNAVDVGNVPPEPEAAAAPALLQAAGAAAAGSGELALESAVVWVPRSAVATFQFILMLAAAVLVYELRVYVWPGAAGLAAKKLRDGLAVCTVELSELRLGGIGDFETESIIIAARVGNQRSVRTGVMPRQEGAASVSFGERLLLDIAEAGPTCVLSVFDADCALPSCLARVELPAHMLSDMARRRQEYFRFDLRLQQGAEQPEADAQQPYLAVRLREVET